MTEPRVARRRRARILIVEDDIELVRVLKEALGARWDIASARDADGAVGEWERARADAIVLDLRLGAEHDGIDVYQELRRRIGTRPPALILSAASEATQAARALQLPIIRKPFDVKDLVAALEKLLVPGAG